MILHRSGLTNEQKAVVLARSLGVLKREEIGRAMRSCYPDFIVGKRRTTAVSLVEEGSTAGLDEGRVGDEEEEFIELDAEHQSLQEDPLEAYDEPDVAEALAVSWRERRKEMGQLQRATKFKKAQDVRRFFKVEIEELKRRTKCNKCGAVGRWARECKAPGKGTSSKGSSFKKASKGKENAAAMVIEEDFVTMVSSQSTSRLSLQLVREKPTPTPDTSVEQLLVSSAGYRALGSGCDSGRPIIGADTLAEFMELWKARDVTLPAPFDEVNHFKYGKRDRSAAHPCSSRSGRTLREDKPLCLCPGV